MSVRYSLLEADGLARLQARVSSLIGQPWSVAHLSYGGEVRAGFGSLVARPRGRFVGQWTLGTRGSPWVLAVGGKEAATETDAAETWLESLRVLKGKVVIRATVTLPGPDLHIEFEDGSSFAILASREREWMAWELFCPDGATVTVSCDGSWVEGRRDEVADE